MKKILCILFLPLWLSACGKPGPLYLPKPDAPPATTQSLSNPATTSDQ